MPSNGRLDVYFSDLVVIMGNVLLGMPDDRVFSNRFLDQLFHLHLLVDSLKNFSYFIKFIKFIVLYFLYYKYFYFREIIRYISYPNK